MQCRPVWANFGQARRSLAHMARRAQVVTGVAGKRSLRNLAKISTGCGRDRPQKGQLRAQSISRTHPKIGHKRSTWASLAKRRSNWSSAQDRARTQLGRIRPKLVELGRICSKSLRKWSSSHESMLENTTELFKFDLSWLRSLHNWPTSPSIARNRRNRLSLGAALPDELILSLVKPSPAKLCAITFDGAARGGDKSGFSAAHLPWEFSGCLQSGTGTRCRSACPAAMP